MIDFYLLQPHLLIIVISIVLGLLGLAKYNNESLSNKNQELEEDIHMCRQKIKELIEENKGLKKFEGFYEEAKRDTIKKFKELKERVSK